MFLKRVLGIFRHYFSHLSSIDTRNKGSVELDGFTSKDDFYWWVSEIKNVRNLLI